MLAVPYVSFGLMLVGLVYVSRLLYKYEYNHRKNRTHIYHHQTLNSTSRYLIDTPNCKIPNSDPFGEDIFQFYQSHTYESCSNKPLLSYTKGDVSNATVIRLYIDHVAALSYSKNTNAIQCCFSSINREPVYMETIAGLIYSPCTLFQNGTVVEGQLIQVKCHVNSQIIYVNVHALVRDIVPSASVKEVSSTTYNVMLVGIDSMSKMNLVRSMPKTLAFLKSNSHFISLDGYTKIEDNTFPNLMAILTGMNYKQIYSICRPETHVLDDCHFVWKYFKQLGYITAYAEDDTANHIFNYPRMGFKFAPTDLYVRPYMLAAENLSSNQYIKTAYCAGPETSGERILNLALDFADVFHMKRRAFSIWWMSTFSHEDINAASQMDLKVMQFLESLIGQNRSNNTIFIFFSDHGFRFGEFRLTHSGWLEERLPFFYIYIPDSFQLQYPTEYQNLLINAHRLTSPYDVYITLQHIAKFAESGHKVDVASSMACKNCKSLFEPIDHDRICSDAGIERHWCVCQGHEYESSDSVLAIGGGNFLVKQINQLVSSFKRSGIRCAVYYFHKVLRAGVTRTNVKLTTSFNFSMLLLIEARPTARYEATLGVTLTDKYNYQLLGSISRMDRYSKSSTCVKHASLKKYCICDSLFMPIRNAFCDIFPCL